MRALSNSTINPTLSSCAGFLLALQLGCASAAPAPVHASESRDAGSATPSSPDDEGPQRPTVRVDAANVTLNDATVGSVAAIASVGRITKVDTLFEGLKQIRTRWKEEHPDRSFDGEYVLRIASDVPTMVAISVVMTSAFAGYPTAYLETGAGVVKLRTPVPGPPGSARDQSDPSPLPKLQLEVHVTETSFEMTMIPISSEASGKDRRNAGAARQRTLRKEPGELKAAIAQECRDADRICFDALRLTTAVAATPFREFDIVLSAVAMALRGSRPGSGSAEVPALTVSFRSGSGRVGGPPPQIRIGAQSVEGRLAPEEIRRVVRANFGSFGSCYEDGLRRNPDLTGRVAVRFVIDRDGRVSWAGDADERVPDAALGGLGVRGKSELGELRKLLDESQPNQPPAGPPMPDKRMIACVIAGFRKLAFPRPEGGIVTVVYPMMFSPGG